MYENMKWLTDSLLSNQKIIFWGHNSHISKSGTQNPSSYFGKNLAQLKGNETYSIGLYAREGTLADTKKRIVKIDPVEKNSVENLLYVKDNEASFIDLTHNPNDKCSEWMSREVKSLSWGKNEIKIVPKKEYDGIILINKVYPTNFIK